MSDDGYSNPVLATAAQQMVDIAANVRRELERLNGLGAVAAATEASLSVMQVNEKQSAELLASLSEQIVLARAALKQAQSEAKKLIADAQSQSRQILTDAQREAAGVTRQARDRALLLVQNTTAALKQLEA